MLGASKISELKKRLELTAPSYDEFAHCTYGDTAKKFSDIIFTVETLSKSAIPVPEYINSGIYLLFFNKGVVYVGKSNNVGARIAQHKAAGTKKFDSFCFLAAPECLLDALESMYFLLLRPAYNSCPPRYRDIDEACDIIRCAGYLAKSS